MAGMLSVLVWGWLALGVALAGVALLALLRPFAPLRQRLRAVLVLSVGAAMAALGVQFLQMRGATHDAVSVTVALPGELRAGESRVACPVGAQATGTPSRVRGQAVAMLAAPRPDAPRVANGAAGFVELDSTARVVEECRQDGFARILVREPAWLRDTHRGWIAGTALVDEATFAREGFTEADLPFDAQLAPYRGLIVPALNQLRRQVAPCRDDLDPRTVTFSPARSQPGNPAFFVACGRGTETVNVHFNARLEQR